MQGNSYKFILVFLFLALTMSFVSAALTDGLKGYWNFDEAAGSTLIDSLGFYNGTTTGATVNQPGKINKSYYFDGVNDFITHGSDNLGSLYSISLWVKIDTNTAFYTILSGQGSSNPNAWQPGLTFYDVNNDFKFAGNYSDTAVNTGYMSVANATWYHVVVTANNKTAKIYLDGNLIEEQTSLNTKAWTQLRYIARDDAGHYFKGYIDEMGIWNKELSQSEVTELYNSGNGNSYPFLFNPTASVGTGTYNNNFSVTLDNNGVADIYYTTDGSDPDDTDTLYSGAISITGTTTLKAISWVSDENKSGISSYTYTMVVAGTPTADKDSGLYYDPFNVTLTKTGTTTGTTLTYTLTGDDPTIASTEYTTPIEISADTTLKFAEFKTGYTATSIVTKTYEVREPIANFYFYDENTLLPIPTVTITDANGSAYTSDINGLWTTSLSNVAKNFTISKTGYDSRPLEFYFKRQDANYNFLLNPTGLDSNIGFIVKDSNNNLWTNKYLMFSKKDYNITEIIGDTNADEVNSNATSYILFKTFDYTDNLYYPLISKVTNQIKRNSTSGTAAFVMVRYTYNDDTILEVENTSTSNTYTTKTYTNTSASKPVKKVEVLLKMGSTSYTTYEKDTNVYFTGYINNIDNVIINSLLTSSQGYATGTMGLNALIAEDYNAYIYDESGTYVEQITPLPIVMDLNFSSATSGQVFYNDYIEEFTNVTNYALALGNVPDNTLITVLFNDQKQKYELLYKNRNEFEIGKVNLKVLTFSDYNGVVFVRPLIGQAKATDATIKAYIYESGVWKMIGQAYSAYEDGQAYFYTRISDLLYLVGSKEGYENISKSTPARLYWTNVDVNIETLFNNKNIAAVNLNFFETANNYQIDKGVWTNYSTFDDEGNYITNQELIINIYVMSDIAGTWSYKKYEDNVLVSTTNIGDSITYGVVAHAWLTTKDYKYEFYYNDELIRTMNFKYDSDLISGYVDEYNDEYDISDETASGWKDKDLFVWLFLALIVLAIIGEYFAKAAISVFVIFGVIFGIMNFWILITVSPVLFYVGLVVIRKLIID